MSYYQGLCPGSEVIAETGEVFCSCPADGTTSCGAGYDIPQCPVLPDDVAYPDVTDSFLQVATIGQCDTPPEDITVKTTTGQVRCTKYAIICVMP